MSAADIESVMRLAFDQCDAEGCPLDACQQQVILDVVLPLLAQRLAASAAEVVENPLEDLTPEQRQELLAFIQEQRAEERPWKVQLLNDWLQGRESGRVQFIREIYGVQWLERVQPIHINRYLDAETATLAIGDRIEVSNALWEWVQEDRDREWLACTVIGLREPADDGSSPASCIVRFENGMEYEIQGVYEWNRYNWRFPEA